MLLNLMLGSYMIKRLYILGATNDEKGTQLESLISCILKKKGCRDIKVNQLHAGGSEIDVTAFQTQLSDSIKEDQYVICECKAYAKPVALPDWLKFLGKVFSASLEKGNVYGIFVALSGVNGNVNSAYDTYKCKCPNVELVTKESLLHLIEDSFDVASVDLIESLLQKYVGAPVHELSLAYYNHEIYWVAFFNEVYVILSRKGGVISDEEEKSLVPLMCIKNHVYLNIDKMRSSIRTRLFLNRLCVLYIVQESNMKSSLEDFYLFVSQFMAVSIEELKRALQENPFIKKDALEYKFVVDDLLDFYRYNLQDEFGPLDIILTDFYQNSIDESLLHKICEYQSGLTIKNDMIDNCLYILRRSPSALLYAVTKDRFIAQGRLFKGIEKIPGLDDVHTNTFIRNIYSAFVRDSENPNIIQILAGKFSIGKIKTDTKIKVVESDGTSQEFEFDLPLTYGKIGETYAPIIQIKEE